MKPAAARKASLAHEVRLIGGLYKRSKLPVPDAPGLRPTPDRVRETVFNWLGQDLAGWRCLDAFAGSGALGFEAASRGAVQVLLLERDVRLVRGLEQSKLRLKADTLNVQAADALAWMKRCPADSFELVFIDPPFDSQLQIPALEAASRVVVPDGFIYLEAGRALVADDVSALGLALWRQGRAGAVHFHLLQRRYTAPEERPQADDIRRPPPKGDEKTWGGPASSHELV